MGFLTTLDHVTLKICAQRAIKRNDQITQTGLANKRPSIFFAKLFCVWWVNSTFPSPHVHGRPELVQQGQPVTSEKKATFGHTQGFFRTVAATPATATAATATATTETRTMQNHFFPRQSGCGVLGCPCVKFIYFSMTGLVFIR